MASAASIASGQSTAETVIAPNPAAAACTPNSVTLSTSNADSYNKDVGASASICWVSDKEGPDPKKAARPFSRSGFYFADASATYDDKWKDGKAALSTVTQQYSGMLGSLGKLKAVPVTVLVGYNHSNTQGIILEQGYGVGTWWHFNLPTPVAIKAQRTLLISATVRGTFDQLYNSGADVNRLGLGFYSAINYSITMKASLSGSFKGFVPAANPLIYGNAFAEIDYKYSLSKTWTATLSVTDSYYATVPANFRPNSFTSKIGLTYKIGGGS